MNPIPTLTDDEVSRIGILAHSDATNQGPDSGFGALRTERGCLPLEAVHVRAVIDGLVASVELVQTFCNAHEVPLEATYIFPLPDRAAVTRFRLEVAGRVIEGALKERGQARQEYDRAIQEGHRAAITEEERPGVFTLRVGNLPPGESARVFLTLAGPLPCQANEATFRFPLVVAPRYIPGTPLPGTQVGDGVAQDTDAVPDASRISPPVLLPGFPNPVRLLFSIEILPSDLQPHAFRSSLHTITEEQSSGRHRLFVQPGERLDRDFILRFRLGSNQIAQALSLVPDAAGDEGTFLLTLLPPTGEPDALGPRDVAFVLDRSGSMNGWKMVAARRALARMVDTLNERDRFCVLAFDTVVERPGSGGHHGAGIVSDGNESDSAEPLQPASDRNRFRAVEFLARVDARGGTEMSRPLAEAVRALRPEGEWIESGAASRDRILVLITDGQVGNEDQLLRQLSPQLEGIRVFTLGIDQAVNAAFLHRLADLGGGHCELVESEDRLDEVLTRIHRLISTPVLTDLSLEAIGFRVIPDSFCPARLPDLFVGTPLIVQGRFQGPPEGSFKVYARGSDGTNPTRPGGYGGTGGVPPAMTVRGVIREMPALASVWARGRVRQLEDLYVVGREDRTRLEREIIATSLRFGVLSRFTAYLAYRSEKVNPGGEVHSVVQPVETPSGWAETRGQTAQGSTSDLFCASFAPSTVPNAPPMLTMSEATEAWGLLRRKSSDRGRFLGPQSRVAGKEEPPLRASGPPSWKGWIARGLERLGLKRRGPDESVREKILALLHWLSAVQPGNQRHRKASLQALLKRLETIHEMLRQQHPGAPQPPVLQHLAERLDALRQLLAGQTIEEPAFREQCQLAGAVLKDWLAGPGQQPPSREGFWK